MKVLELYSGVGGMHYALKESKIGDSSEVVAAVELSQVCNEVYRYNFPNTPILNKNIVSLDFNEVNQLKPELLLMSPPCQPFSRLGKQKDMNDTRNESLMQIIKFLPQLATISYILLENVKGFEVSKTRNKLLESLQESNFVYEEYLLNSRQFGVCNSRLRYYLLAWRVTKDKSIHVSNEIQETFSLYEYYSNVTTPKKIEEVLEFPISSLYWNNYLVPEMNVRNYLGVMDVVATDDDDSCCFTRGYTRFIGRSGSVLSVVTRKKLNELGLNYEAKDSALEDKVDELLDILKLRYFTPKEIARLMTFPEKFKFPDHITNKQRYKMISNSINIAVVSSLISYLTGHNV